MVLQKIPNAGITLNMDKCDLLKSKIHFLGHITADGIRPDPAITESIRRMQPLSNVNKVKSLMRMVNQLGKFIPQ